MTESFEAQSSFCVMCFCDCADYKLGGFACGHGNNNRTTRACYCVREVSA